MLLCIKQEVLGVLSDLFEKRPYIEIILETNDMSPYWIPVLITVCTNRPSR